MQGERRIDLDSRKRVEQLEVRYSRSVQRMWLAIILLFVSAGYAVFVNNQLVDRVTGQRKASIRDNCESQNKRHDNTITTIDRVIVIALAQQPGSNDRLRALAARAKTERSPDRIHQLYLQSVEVAGPKLSAQAQQGRASNVLLIDALAPRRNCDRVVDDST